LSNITFNAKPGEITALIGPNGAGKSAVLNCISGHYKPTTIESISVNGKPVHKLNPHERAKVGISRTFQHIHLVSELTVLENVMTGLTPVLDDGLLSAVCRPWRQTARERLRRELAMESLETFDLLDVSNKYGSSLPMGTRRRIDLARAMVSRPSVLLLDEPASGMSRSERDLIPELIHDAQQRYPFIAVWIEHDIDLIFSVANAVHVLKNGSMIASGRPQDDLDGRKILLEAYFGRAL
jgi:branched-chain amino acid transport system ATP-binding protein